MQIFYFGKLTKKSLRIMGVTVCMVFLAAIFIAEADAENTAEIKDSSQASAFAAYEKSVALTFDDGPGYKTTMALLDGLKERDVRATFFVLGSNIEKRNEVITRMYEEGHTIGNHTYSHIQLDMVNLDCAIKEITDTNQIIYDLTGEYPKFFRPPYGTWSTELEDAIAMTPVLWTLDTNDWSCKNVSTIVEYVVKNVEDGDVVLMHDIYDTSVAAALEIVDRLKLKGYMFVTVDELLLE
jgi:peptidoglycan/xylan/chitin deacetylase (PgdA/CDA1 family)